MNQKPFVIRHHALETWPCVSWTLDDWKQNCSDQTRFKFRVHKRKTAKDYEINWENEAIDYVEASMSQFIDHIKYQNKPEFKTSKHNVFSKYSLTEYCLYSAYNYVDQITDLVTRNSLNESIKWQNTGIFDPNLQHEQYTNISNTIWIGTGGSYTPCHQDTYGYNFVAQLYGKKLWILFPPKDTENVYPTRIPYEESSIFSQVNINFIDLIKYPKFSQVTPYIIELNPGDLLFVPYRWWHYVENVANSCNDNVSISVNTWISHIGKQQMVTKDHINECITQLLFNSLFKACKNNFNCYNWLNCDAQLLTESELINNLINFVHFHNPENFNYNKPDKLQVEYLQEATLEDLFNCKPLLKSSCSKNKNQRIITPNDIVNAILDSDVIELIVKKLTEN